MPELCDYPATELVRLIAAGEISPVELLAACRARIEAVDGRLNAIVATCWPRARREAEAAERAVRAKEPLGPLHGLPLGIKDLTLTEGLRTTFGSPQFARFMPAKDQAVVAALRAAGGIVCAKTNTPEFGAGANTVNPVYGATGNPFAPELTCAGSSGGSAVALATGMLPLATGSDMGGSLRNPAAFCGVVGMRPSPGMVPNELHRLGWSPLAVDGPMARNVPDLALLFEVMARADPGDPLAASARSAVPPEPPVELAGLRIAISEDLGFAPVDKAVRRRFRQVIAPIGDLFGRVEAHDPPLDGADDCFEVLRAIAFVAAHKETYEQAPELLGPNILANVEQGLLMSLADVARAMTAQTEIYRRFLEFMADYDLLICPAMAVPPFPHRELYPSEINGQPLRSYFHWLALAYGLTLTGHPVICLPAGRDPAGLPFGIQLCGRRGGDRRLLAIAAALEQALQADPDLARPLPDMAALAASGT